LMFRSRNQEIDKENRLLDKTLDICRGAVGRTER